MLFMAERTTCFGVMYLQEILFELKWTELVFKFLFKPMWLSQVRFVYDKFIAVQYSKTSNRDTIL